MNPTDFIQKHINNAPLHEGFSAEIARGAEHGVDYYRRCSQASRKGSMYEDCLFRARQWALGQATATERKQAKKKPGREVAPPGLF
ncbi:hypothetical protein [Salmonella enterica]|uniref:hypothetical protein n=1 Tax=Salmonella enterica TaxID=28901 RepID=UPI0009AEA386|nr:hypothetical protein [Salmonella enterica]